MPRRRRNWSRGGSKKKARKLEPVLSSPSNDHELPEKPMKTPDPPNISKKVSVKPSKRRIRRVVVADECSDPDDPDPDELDAEPLEPLPGTCSLDETYEQTEDDTCLASPSAMVSVTLEVNEDGEVSMGNQGKENNVIDFSIKTEVVGEMDSHSHPRILMHDELNPELISELERSLNAGLPPDWFCKASEDGLNVMLLSRCREKAIQRRIFFPFRGGVEISVHRRPLLISDCHEHLEGLLPIVPITFTNCPEFIEHALKVVGKVWSLEICGGADQNEFPDLWTSEKSGSVDLNPYGEIRYVKTFRSELCKLLVNPHRWRCRECLKLSTALKRRDTMRKPQPVKQTGISSGFLIKNPNPVQNIPEKTMAKSETVYILQGGNKCQKLALSVGSDNSCTLKEEAITKSPISPLVPQIPLLLSIPAPCLSEVKTAVKKDLSEKSRLVVEEIAPKTYRTNIVRQPNNFNLLNDAQLSIASKIKMELEKCAVPVDDNLSKDFTEILSSCILTPVQKQFLDVQVELGNIKKNFSMRWHPTLIRFALLTRSTANAAATGVITLPSGKKLFNFSQVLFKIKEVQKADFKYLCQQYALNPSEKRQMYHVLLIDEIDVQNNLVYQRSNGELIGFVKLSDVKTEVDQLEAYILSERIMGFKAQYYSMLIYMVKCVSHGLTEVVCVLDGDKVSKEILYNTTWDIIGSLEDIRVKVLAICCNGSPIMKEFISLHPAAVKLESRQVYITDNLKSQGRLLFFFVDAGFILKQIRNCFELSGSPGTCPSNQRVLTKNKELIVWKTIVKLYLGQKYQCPKLNAQNVFLNEYSRKKTSNASAVMSDFVAKEIKSKYWPHTTETVTFISRVHDFFNCILDVDVAEGKTPTEPMPPFTSIEDKRFTTMLDFLDYLSSWRAEVEEIPNLSPTEKSNLLLDQGILYDLEVSLRAFRDASLFLWTEGIKEIPPNTFWLEPLGKFLEKGWFGFMPNHRVGRK